MRFIFDIQFEEDIVVRCCYRTSHKPVLGFRLLITQVV